MRDHLFKDSRKGRVFPVSRPRKGVKEAVLEYALRPRQKMERSVWRTSPSTPGGPIRSGCSLPPGSIRSGGDGKYGSRAKGAIALQSARLQFFHPVSGEKMEFALAMPAGEPWDYFI